VFAVMASFRAILVSFLLIGQGLPNVATRSQKGISPPKGHGSFG
jgi:hypothetical protein